jgi:hypothetical protein
MNYQLVLQWPSNDASDYDGLLHLEELLVSRLADDCEIDGHDLGSGKMNIFILTDDPRRTFESAATILKEGSHWADLRAAYRGEEGEEYTILWPENLQAFSVV